MNLSETKASRFPWKLFWLALATLLAGHIGGTALWDWLQQAGGDPPTAEPERSHWPAWLALGAGLGVLFYVAYYRTKNSYVGDAVPWYMKVLPIMGGAFVALSVHELFFHGWKHWGVFLLMAVGFHFLSQAHEKVEEAHHTAVGAKDPGPTVYKRRITHLIMLVSDPSHQVDVISQDAQGNPVAPYPVFGSPRPAWKKLPLVRHTDPAFGTIQKLLVPVVPFRDAITEISKLFPSPFFNWVQNLRSLRGFSPPLVRIWLVGSSDHYLKVSKRFMECYFERPPKDGEKTWVKRLGWHRKPPEGDYIKTKVVEKFDDMDSVHLALRQILHEEKPDLSRVVIDITGGFAATSVAAAVTTLWKSTLLQWVPTNNPDAPENQKNRIYDLRARRPVTLE
jgi:hypothetical protein